MRKSFCLMVFCLMAVVNVASAEIIRGINLDFVSIGNAGNAADITTGLGSVGDNYRIGKDEVTNAQWHAFTAVAGVPTGNDNGYFFSYYTGDLQPTAYISWYEAAQFCNYLTSGDKSKGAYQFSGNNTNPGSFIGVDRAVAEEAYGTIYVIPTEDEWYKAAYFKPNGSGYSLYANGLNTIPAADNGWNYGGGSYSAAWNVGIGAQEQNGTFDMMGNVWEWNETLLGGDNLEGYRCIRGGSFNSSLPLTSSYPRTGGSQSYDGSYDLGFRVASVPEPSTLLLLGLGGVVTRKFKDRK